MAESEALQSIVKQSAIQTATVAVMVLRERDASANTASQGEVHRQRHGGSALKLLSFNWNAPGKYVDSLNFEM